MTATKTPRTLLTSQSLAAGASVSSTEWDLSSAYAGRLFVKITNGGTAPTTVPIVTFYSGEATGIKRKVWSVSGDLVNSSANDYNFYYDLADMFANCTIVNGATNAITVEVYGQEATTI